jgi:hypothetical protein
VVSAEWIVLVSACSLLAAFGVMTMALHEIRSKLFLVLLRHARHLAADMSDWRASGAGYLGVFRSQALWGRMSVQIYAVPEARWWLFAARGLDFARRVCGILGSIGFMGFGAWAAWTA